MNTSVLMFCNVVSTLTTVKPKEKHENTHVADRPSCHRLSKIIMTSQSLLERFFAHLRMDPEMITDVEGERVAWPPLKGGDRAGTRIEFIVSEPELRLALSQREAASIEFWPDVSPEIATFRMLYTHMMETAESLLSEGVRSFRLREGEFVKES